MIIEELSLAQPGWRPFHAQQMTLEDLESGFPARVAGPQRPDAGGLGDRCRFWRPLIRSPVLTLIFTGTL